MSRQDRPPRKSISGKAPKLAPAQQGPRTDPLLRKMARTKTRVRKRIPDSEDDEPAPPPKRANRTKNAAVKREPVIISDDGYEPVSSRKTVTRKVTKAGSSVTVEDENEQTVEVLDARREEPLKMRLFYPETLSKQRHAKRIIGVLPLGQNHEKGSSENAPPNIKPGWAASENTIDLFIEVDSAIGKISNKCQLEFTDAATRDSKTLGHIRRQIAEFLGIRDVFTIQLESSTLAAKPSTFKARGTICDRVNAIWNEIEHHDQKTVQEVFKNVKAPWLRVRITEYVIISLPELKLEVCITPSDAAVVGDVRKIAAAFTRNNLPFSFHVNINDVEILQGEDDIRFLDASMRHKSIITCVPEVYECSVCAEEVGFLDWPGKLNATACEHESSTCTACLRIWITEALDNNNTSKITCPECEVVFEHNDLKKHATEEEFARYDRLSTRAALSAIPEFRWCIAPFCESGQIHDSKGSIMTCTECKFRSCTNCDREFHDGETCDQYTKRMGIQDDLIKQSEKAIEQMSKQCPGCKSRIEKDGGCDHMTCQTCYHQFCWLCNADYKDINREGNTAHTDTCLYHSGNIPDPHNLFAGQNQDLQQMRQQLRHMQARLPEPARVPFPPPAPVQVPALAPPAVALPAPEPPAPEPPAPEPPAIALPAVAPPAAYPGAPHLQALRDRMDILWGLPNGEE